VADLAALVDPVEERPWRSLDSVSACAAGTFLIATIATVSANGIAQTLSVVAPARPPVRLRG